MLAKDKSKYFQLLPLLGAFYCSVSLAETASLVFNVTGQPPLNTPSYDGFMDEVAREALNRIGYKLIINKLPAERALRQVNQGKIDGEMSRIKGIETIYENLVRVPEKIMDWEFVVFSKKPIDMTNGWKSLEDKNIGFITGWKILEKNVPQSAIVTQVKNSEQLFNLLERDRVDYVIYEFWGGNRLIKLRGLKDVEMRLPSLESRSMFIYLHKKHNNVVPELASAIFDMKKDGSYENFVRKHLTVNIERQ